MKRTFVVRARSAPTESEKFLAAVGSGSHTEILAHTLMNAVFVAQSHRPDVSVHLVLESTRDFSRVISIDTNEIGDICGFHEEALLTIIARALDLSAGMGKEETRAVDPGISVHTQSFEKLVGQLATDHQLFMMDPKGVPIRDQAFRDNACFILTDHIPMPKKSFNTLKRHGAKKISLGPTMLFASQCVVIIHNQLDLATF